MLLCLCEGMFCPIPRDRRGPVGTEKQFHLEISHWRLPINLCWDTVRHGWCHVLWDDLEAPMPLVGGLLSSAWAWGGIQVPPLNWGRAFLPVTPRLKERVLYWHKNRNIDHWNQMENPEINLPLSLWLSAIEVQVSSGLPQRERLWVQQTGVWHKPSWRRSLLTPP